MSGYAHTGGYTQEELDNWLQMSEKINRRKDRINRLLGMATGLIRNSDQGADVLLGDVELDIKGERQYKLRVRKDYRTGMLELAVGYLKTDGDRFDTIFELRHTKELYFAQDIPAKLVGPISRAMPKLFDLIAERYPYFRTFPSILAESSEELDQESVGRIAIEPGDHVIIIERNIVQLRKPQGSGYTVKAELKWNLGSIHELANFLSQLSGLRCEIVTGNGTAIEAIFR